MREASPVPMREIMAGAVLSLAAAAAVGAAAVAKGADGQSDGPEEEEGCILFEGEQLCGLASPDGACVLHAEKGWVCA